MNILTRLRGPRPSTQAGYEKLVRDVADGKPTPDNYEEILAGRTAADFQNDVRRLLGRREAAAALADKSLESDAARSDMAVTEAAKALEQDQFAKLLAAYEAKQVALVEAKQARNLAHNEVASRRGPAQSLLIQTASREIDQELAAVGGEIQSLQARRQNHDLNSTERDERESAEALVATLPGSIERLSGADRAAAMAKLVVARNLLAEFAVRLKEVARVDAEIAKWENKREKVAAKRLDPERMAFTSTPKNPLDVSPVRPGLLPIEA